MNNFAIKVEDLTKTFNGFVVWLCLCSFWLFWNKPYFLANFFI